MTEAEWLTSEDVVTLITHAESCSSYRKRRLFLLDCAQRVCHLLGMGTRRHPTRELLTEAYEAVEEGAELSLISRVRLTAEGEAARRAADLDRAVEEARGKSLHAVRNATREALAANLILVALSGERWRLAVWDINDDLSLCHAEVENYRDEVYRENLHALRCIVGNPYHPVAIDPRWRTEHAVGIALKMYDERDFAAMPILADALEEAGCDVEAVLTHCREPGPHARGCWVVDGVLGKR